MNRKKLILICFWILYLSGHCYASRIDPNTHTVFKSEDETQVHEKASFTRGYKLFEKKEYRKACPCFFHFLNNNSPDVTDYEWAEFFFGICLKKCGLSHAAVDVLSHLVVRKPNPKIVSYCMEMFEEITRTVPFDQDLIIHKVICDQEYGFVERKISDFINYYQGVFDWEHGFFQWGNNHFKKISPKSYYFYKYLYQKALYRIYHDQIDDAMVILEQILEDPFQSDNLKDETRMTLARLLYEKGRFSEAEIIYQRIQKPILEQARDLLERAWVHYRMGNPEKAMGLLYAYEAPCFQDHFTPEYYILKSFIYKDVCHYKKALSVVQEFKIHFSGSLNSIYNRGKPVDDPALLLVLLNKKKINQTWEFLRLLDRERVECQNFQNESLHSYLEKLYTLQIQESVDSIRKQIKKEYENIANELLRYEEEAHLMEYEIGLDMYQRVSQYHYKEEPVEAKEDEYKKVVYPFQGEFWNDELAHYNVVLPNKCKCAEEWNIFFQ